MNKKPLQLRDYLLMGLISVAFGIVYWALDYISGALTTAFAFTGFGHLAGDIVFGIWMMASVVTMQVIRKPFVGVITEIIAAVIEVILGNAFGPGVIVSGFVQGFGVELGYIFTGYKDYTLRSALLGGFLGGIVEFAYQWFAFGYAQFTFGVLVIKFIFHILSSLFFAGYLAQKISVGLEKAGVLTSSASAEHTN